MSDYLNPHKIYTDRLGVSDLEKTTPTVKDSLTTNDDEVAYATPICSGKCFQNAPVRENLTTDKAVNYYIDGGKCGHGSYSVSSDDIVTGVSLGPPEIYIGDRKLNCDEAFDWFQEAIDEKHEREQSSETALGVKNATTDVLCSYCGKRMTVPAVDYRPGCYAYICHDCANPFANGRQVKNVTGVEEIEWATVNLQVAKPGNEMLPNCGTETCQSAECAWCGPGRIGWFSVQFWVRSCYGKRKWMSVTQDWKKKVKYCPMCGRKLEVEG